MSNELHIRSTTGSTVYAIVRSPAALPWNGSAFEAWSNAHYATYAIALAEQGSSGFFAASFPAAITSAGAYSIEFFNQVGGSPSESLDTYIGGIARFEWDGSTPTSSPTLTALTTLAYVKDFGNIAVSTYDAYLTNRIAAATAAVQAYCNRLFWIQDYAEILDGPGSTTLLLGQYPVTAIAQVTRYFTRPVPEVIPGTEFFVGKSGIIGVKPSSQFTSWFGYSDQDIKAEYTAGYASIPVDVQEAVAMIVMEQYFWRGVDVTMQSERIGDYSYTRGKRMAYLPQGAQALLSGYKQNVV